MIKQRTSPFLFQEAARPKWRRGARQIEAAYGPAMNAKKLITEFEKGKSMNKHSPIKIEHISELFRLAQSADIPPSNLVGLDFDKLLVFFEDSALSEAEAKQIILSLAHLIQPFVDIGFGVHPVQIASHEFPEKFIDSAAINPDNNIHSEKSISKELEDAVKNSAAERLES